MYDQALVSATRVRRVSISIPANNAAAVTLRSLVASSVTAPERIVGIKVYKYQAGNTTDRAAFDIADTASGSPLDLVAPLQRVAAGEDYYEPALNDADSYVHSTDTNAVPAVAIVYTVLA